jgi:hypothetical protein
MVEKGTLAEGKLPHTQHCCDAQQTPTPAVVVIVIHHSKTHRSNG